ncbi:hypothetical protein [Streptomyces litchfieldiae]|uniref:Uncharacterized protein n=1 Tax=Streptomyces litchfieldiae TaxID=3075543 RepID=A0ABU2MTH7_9ACTN|nr:hypothetical protein [Streptomyces sp. DSM 44938]MDT0344942.1 hypothetical protein [Streptomyces sp. DSM 44938]
MTDAQAVLAGYVLALPAPREIYQNSQLVPAHFITVSRCLNPADRSTTRTGLDARPRLLAVGMLPDDARELLDEMTDTFAAPDEPGSDVANPLKLLPSGAPMPADCRLLGFEVVGVGWAMSEFHSWLCHSYEREVEEQLGIRPNAVGLLDTHENATRIRDWMEEQPPENAPEPVFWTVVAVAEIAELPLA